MQHYVNENKLDKRTVEVLVSHGHLPTRFSERRNPMSPVDFGPGKGPFNPAWNGGIQEYLDRQQELAQHVEEESEESESLQVVQSPDDESNDYEMPAQVQQQPNPQPAVPVPAQAAPALQHVPGGQYPLPGANNICYLYRFGCKPVIHKRGCHHLSRREVRPPSMLNACRCCQETLHLGSVQPDLTGVWHRSDHCALWAGAAVGNVGPVQMCSSCRNKHMD